MAIQPTVKSFIQALLLCCCVLLASTQIAQAAPHQQELTPGTGGASPPPLPPICGGGGTPVGDYQNPICCVSGYIYLDGVPTDQAKITVTGPNGHTKEATYATNTERPHYSISLQNEPLHIRPGDPVTITATYDGQTTTEYFIAKHTRGHQIDLVLPDIDSAWVHAHLSGRQDHGMAYDQSRQETVLFGGMLDRGALLGDTWIWDGHTWTQQVTPFPRPAARQGHTLAYHEARQQVILFGGEDANGNYLNDMWSWDGSSWLLVDQEGALPPPARRDHAMIYDREGAQLLLFGGRNSDALGDAWVWHEGWTEVPNGPAARYQHGMAYDPALKATLLFGGQNDSDFFSDTWIWDSEGWVEQQPTEHPPTLTGHTLAHHPQAGILLFDGDLWVWDGSTNAGSWQALNPAGADARALKRTDHAMVYDGQRQQIVLFGGVISAGPNPYEPADTWVLTDQATTWQPANTPPPFARWKNVAMSYEQNGAFLVFGGESSDVQNRTFRWQSSGWTELAPSNQPPPRKDHRMARAGSSQLSSCDGTDILLFGGIGQNGTYLNDTWRWQGTDWVQQHPTTQPPARAHHTLSYDCQQGQWILFGGLDMARQALNDLWVYNGTEWQEKTGDAVSPAPRHHATLTYDPIQGQMLLFGGENGGTFFNDLWRWDANGWQMVEQQEQAPVARAAHGAAYDPQRELLVITGGARSDGKHLQDTWSWDGKGWRTHDANPELPPAHVTALDYDPTTKQLVGLINQAGGNALGEGIIIQQVLAEKIDVPPLATISLVKPKDAYQSQVISLEGLGGDGDSSDIIVGHRWTHGETVLSTQRVFTMSAAILPLNVQTVTYAVQDDEGNWSAEIQKAIYIRQDNGGIGTETQATWTLLIYVAGDNDLGDWLQGNSAMLSRLESGGQQLGIQVGILYDGPAEDDTVRYILTEEGAWQGESLAEADMGNRKTLSNFVTWGYDTFESDYYALHISSQANGIVGIGLDHHNSEGRSTILTPLELREGLIAGTQDGTRQLDLLHYDGSSFGLLENAAIADGVAHFVVASPNTMQATFAYDAYRDLAAASQNPKAYGEKIIDHYASQIDELGQAYTISLFDMVHFGPLKEAVDVVGNQLQAYVRTDRSVLEQKLNELRRATQKYDSGGLTDYEIDEDDEYVDLGAWLEAIRTNITATLVTDAAQDAQAMLANFVVDHRAVSGSIQGAGGETYAITFTNATGIGIYYPPRTSGSSSTAYDSYIQDKLFHITAGWGWSNFIGSSVPPLSLEKGKSDLMENTHLLMPTVGVEQPAVSLVQESHEVYLPVVNR